MGSLFDNKERTLEGPKAYNGDEYSYYNDSNREDVGCVRDQLESWFSIYPPGEQDDLRARFKGAFQPAFYELYIYALFTQLGYELEVHPELTGTLKRPDYLARRGGEIFYIEVKQMMMMSQGEQNLERRERALLDSINKIDASNFLLKLEEIIFKDNSQPSGKRIVHFFNQELKGYNPDNYTKELEANGFDGMPLIIYDDDKVTIKTKLLPKSPLHRGTQSRSIAAHPAEVKIGNDSSNIRAALESKATKYGRLDAPFIICLNKQSVIADVMELNEALYGNMEFSWSEDPENPNERLRFDGEGFFGNKDNPKFTRLSGVYFTNANSANLSTTAEHYFKHNQFAGHPLDFVLTRTVRDIFNIADDYPKRKLPDLKW